MTLYNPLDKYFKSVTGGIPTGGNVHFRISFPPECGVYSANLVILQGEHKTYVPMVLDHGDNFGVSKFYGDFIPDISGIFQYYFEGYSDIMTHYIKCGDRLYGTLDTSFGLYQLTVYDENFKTPDWIKGGTMYQIFPDRFYNSGAKKVNVPDDRILKTWDEELKYLPDGDGVFRCNDYYGGDLLGIAEKLPYLADLGITVIYLNPIFLAHSNHRYNAADYMQIDPLLGTKADLTTLCSNAKELGIRIILDGVFSHTGDDSVYFNRYKRYGDGGAFSGSDDKYYNWFKRDVHDFHYWWGISSLPEIDEENPDFINHICGEGGVLDYYLDCGVSGWRLDVADELPDVFLFALRDALKKRNVENYILGEVWEDSTTKIAYGILRPYLLGGQLDSVMNYPLKNAVLEYIKFGYAEKLLEPLLGLLNNYPKPALDTAMNFLSTHDVERAMTFLTGPDIFHNDRREQRSATIDYDQYLRGRKLLVMAYTILFFMPGIPSIYYGDELGMWGYRDPFNRETMRWDSGDYNLLSDFEILSKIRKEHNFLADADICINHTGDGVFSFSRFSGDKCITVITNRGFNDYNYTLSNNEHLLYGNSEFNGVVYVPQDSVAVISNL